MIAGRRALQRATGAEALVRTGDAPLDALEVPALSDKDRAAADWALKHRQPAGHGTCLLYTSRCV